MNKITTILEPQADGTLHLPLPAELRHGKVEVTALLRAAPDSVSGNESLVSPAPLRATPEMLRRRKEVFAVLRRMNPFREIPDPAEWQREIRKDRPLEGRE